MIERMIESGIAELTINRPPVNAFSSELWRCLIEKLDSTAANPEVAVAILTATGTRAFSAGADVKETANLSRVERQERAELVSVGLRTLYQFPLPIICAINGPASGGGVNVATLCDYRIATAEAHFSLPEIRHQASAGGGVFLWRIGVPAGAVRALLFGGQRISSSHAFAVHLVDEVVPTNRHLIRARELAETFAVHGRPALMKMKSAALAAEVNFDLFAAYSGANQAAAAPTRRLDEA